jgi:hypothetical protein
VIQSLPKLELSASSWLPVLAFGSMTSSKKHSGKMLLATEKLSGSSRDARLPWARAQSSQNQALDQTAACILRSG